MGTDTNTETALAVIPANGGMVLPVVSAEDARAAIAAYEAMKSAILQPGDTQRIGNKDHIKRSGWVRIARPFGVTVEPVSEQYQTDPDGTWGYAVVVRAVAPNGASMIGDGMCWSSEKAPGQRTRHNVRAHAYTRATNRAISNLVGGGEVSAEELTDYVDSVPAAKPQQTQRALPAPKPAAAAKPAPIDPWIEVRELAASLQLSDDQRAALFAKHKKNRDAILAELREMDARRRDTGELPTSEYFEEEDAAGPDLHDLGTRQAS